MKARISNRLDATETNLTATERFVFLLLLDVVGRLRGDRVSITWSKLHFFLWVFSCVLCALFCRPLTFRRKPTFSPTVERRIERYILRKENSLCVLCAHVPFLSWIRKKKKIIKRCCPLEFVFLSENPKENKTFWCCALFDWVWRNGCCINSKHTYTLSVFCDWTRRRHWRNYWKMTSPVLPTRPKFAFNKFSSSSYAINKTLRMMSLVVILILVSCICVTPFYFSFFFWAGEISIETTAVLMAFFKPNIPCPFLFITTFFFTIWNCVLFVLYVGVLFGPFSVVNASF
jgi:hypothetical protein